MNAYGCLSRIWTVWGSTASTECTAPRNCRMLALLAGSRTKSNVNLTAAASTFGAVVEEDVFPELERVQETVRGDLPLRDGLGRDERWMRARAWCRSPCPGSRCRRPLSGSPHVWGPGLLRRSGARRASQRERSARIHRSVTRVVKSWAYFPP